MKIQDSDQIITQIKSEIIDNNETKQGLALKNDQLQVDKNPNQKKFKKHINLIKQINKQQLRQVLEVYKPSDFQQVIKKNTKEQNKSSLNIKNENTLEQQICREQENMEKSTDATKLEKFVKDKKYLTVITNANNISQRVQDKALEVKQDIQHNQISKAIINEQNVDNLKDELSSQKQISSSNSKATGSSDLSLDNIQKEEQKNQVYFYQKLNNDQKEKYETQQNIIINFQEQYLSSFLSDCQSQTSNKQAQNKEHQLEQLSLLNKCTNSQLLINKNSQQINNQFDKAQWFLSTLDGKIQNQNNKKSFKNNSAHISQQIQKMKNRKVLCENTKLNFLDSFNGAGNLNQDISKYDQGQLDKEQKIKTAQYKSNNNQPNRKRVLSQQVCNYNQQSQQKSNSSQQKYDQVYEQKNLTPISCSQGKYNYENCQIERIRQIDRIKNQGIQFIPQKNESYEKTTILNYNLIVKQKQDLIQKTSQISNQNNDFFNYDQNKTLETQISQNIPIEQRIMLQSTIISQNQTTKNETTHLINQVRQQQQNYLLNCEYEFNQDQDKKNDLLEQINNIYDTPSSVKNILQNIKCRTNSLSYNFKCSQNKKNKQSDITKSNDQQQKTQQGQNLKANNTKNKNNLQDKTKNNEKILNNEKQNVKIRSNMLILNSSPNSNNSNEISNSNNSGNKTADNKRAENVNFRRRSNTNIQKNNTLTPNIDQKQSKDLNQRYTNLFNQLNLDWKIQNIKNFIEQCHPERIMQRSSFMKQFNTLYEIKDYIDPEEQKNAETINSIKSLAIYTKFLIMNNSDYKKLIAYLEKFPNLKVLWITVSVATFGIDKLNCDENSLEQFRQFILEKFNNQLEALYVKFNFDSHDSQWNNRKKTIQQIVTQWDDTYEKIIPIYRCDYQFQGLQI
ncbi:hypothetical protein ABPG72_016005 [Tetrahymena utriculariae]